MGKRACDRCEFEVPRFEIMDRKDGNIQLLCDLCLMQWSVSIAEAVKAEMDAEDRADDRRRNQLDG